MDWLSELAYWAEMEQLVFSQFEIVEVTNELRAVVRGGKTPSWTNILRRLPTMIWRLLERIGLR